MRRRTLPIFVVILCATLATSLRAQVPASRPARPTPENLRAVRAAIDELTREMVVALNDGGPLPRSGSEYFIVRPTPDVTPEVALGAMGQPLSPDPRVHAYVAWQLLSAVPEPAEASYGPALLRLYRSAPAPAPRPGVTDVDRAQMTRTLQRSRAEDEPALSAALERSTDAIDRGNAAILAYRDELFRRLPPSYDALVAGFDDAWVRANSGAEVRQHVRAICEAAQAWAPVSANPQQIRALGEVIVQLKRRQPAQYVSGVTWSDRTRRFSLRNRRQDLNPGDVLDELEDVLLAELRRPGGGLRFRDE